MSISYFCSSVNNALSISDNDYDIRWHL